MRYYLVSWDCEGVEYFKEITADHPDNWAKNHLFDSIKGGKKVAVKPSFNLAALTLRAQANHHRHYEIYVFMSDDSIDPEDIESWFKNDPQGFADWVRKNHSYKAWDDRVRYKKPVIV